MRVQTIASFGHLVTVLGIHTGCRCGSSMLNCDSVRLVRRIPSVPQFLASNGPAGRNPKVRLADNPAVGSLNH